jgi:hypothetical protein
MPPESATGEVRGHRRRACRASPLLKLLVRPSFQPCRGVVRDVSRRGISLFLARGLPVGARLALYARGWRTGGSWMQTGRVVYATCNDGAWRIGCELSRPLSDAELAALM